MHPPIGGGVSTDFKSSNRIKISRLVQILLHFYWFGAPHPTGGGGGWSGYRGGWGWCGDLLDNVQMMWGWHGWRGDDGDYGDDVGTMGTTLGGDHGDHRDHSHGDHMGTFWGLWGWCRDDGDDTWMTWGWHRDDRGTTGTTWGPGDNEITKNAITFEWIKIIELCLKIWDPWTPPHTCRLHLMCRWGVSCPKWHFYAKSALVTLEKFFFLVLHWIPLDHI